MFSKTVADLQWSHFNDLKVCKKLDYFPHVSYFCEYSDPHCLIIYACTHYKTSMYPFYVNIQIHIALQSMLAHIAIIHTIWTYNGRISTISVCKKLEYFPHVSFFVNIQIHIAFQSMLAHIAIKHTIYIIFVTWPMALKLQQIL